MVNTFLVIFLNHKVGSILNPIRKVSLLILPTTFWTTKYIYIYSTKKVKGNKINLDFIFNNFSMYRTGLRLIKINVKEYRKVDTNKFILLIYREEINVWLFRFFFFNFFVKKILKKNYLESKKKKKKKKGNTRISNVASCNF